MTLIDAAELSQRLRRGNEDTRVVDTRWYLLKPGAGRAAYEAGHIPGAIFIDLDDDLADPDGLGAPGRHPLPSPADFRERLERAGIGSEHFVVAYDDAGGTVAARLWWMLDNLGHRAGSAVLDGGLRAWTDAGHPLEDSEPSYAAASLALADAWTNVIERDELSASLGELVLLDARAPERYRGEVEPIDPAKGHIAGAISSPTQANLAADGRFRAASELRRRYASLAEGRPVATYCGSGTSACHNSLAMRIAGLPDPMLYVGSFSEWSRTGMPVVAGAEPVADAERRD